ncbi:MAG: hypothetical protein QNJ55_30245 [Xenococcus sp. MO_188.B8]|nr:hypothetical protein [Xenococcus sp. MO_188.B8]
MSDSDSLVNRDSSFEIRTIHHLSCTGGTLISKCLAAMPNVIMLSEINPLTLGKIRFNPLDPLQQFQAQYKLLSRAELKKAYLARLEIIVEKCIELDKTLIIRDHSHSDFLGKDVRNLNALLEFTSTKYKVKPLVTLRNPVDTYLSMKEKGWGRVENFNSYCERFLMFTEKYSSYPYFLYEDFVINPDSVLEEICGYYDIIFDSNYKNIFDDFQLTGDSGRTSKVISPRTHREYNQEFQQEVLKSEAFKKISKLFGYNFEIDTKTKAGREEVTIIFRQIQKDIEALVPVEKKFILVDEQQLPKDSFPGRTYFHFLEKDGEFWGLPAEDQIAINELERLRKNGASFMIVYWQCFWWFDYYRDFYQYLNSQYPCVLKNDRCVIFGLQEPRTGSV